MITVRVEITRDELAKAWGFGSAAEMDVGLRAGDTESSMPVDDQQLYEYSHGDSRSGICAQCAPFVGLITRGDGSDDIPVPPLHVNCVCFLMPVSARYLSSNPELIENQFEWMESLGYSDLKAVIGRVRADMVASKRATIRQLYDTDFNLINLDDLPEGLWPDSAGGR